MPGHCRNQCRQLKREKDQAKNNTKIAGNNNNNKGGHTNFNSNNKISNKTNANNTNKWQKAKTCLSSLRNLW